MGGSSGTSDPAWMNNTRTLLVLVIVLASALSLPYFRKVMDLLPGHHPVLAALISGVIVAALTYPPMLFADRKYALSNAVLLGLLVAEFAAYGAPFDYPSPLSISFFFFMYAFGREEADHLWPENYHGVL